MLPNMTSPITSFSQLGFASSASGFDYSVLVRGGSSASGSGASANLGGIAMALKNAEANEDKQIAQVAKQADVRRDIARYEKVLKSAKTIDDVLDDPIARKVLLKANGLGDQVDYIGLAKRALKSDPNDSNSVAQRLASTNANWLTFAQTYDVANNGLDRLRANTSGFAGEWAVTLNREGESVTGDLVVKKVNNAWSATVDGQPIGVSVEGDTISLVLTWEDSVGGVHVTNLSGKVGKDGASLSGAQTDDARAAGSWSAKPYYADAIKQVTDAYVGERRLDSLDEQLPGLGTAILFKKVAATLDTPTKVLGSAIGREVVTTALGLPKQIAIQSLNAQEKAVTQRLDISKLSDPKFVDRLVQRYLIQVNGGGLGGVTA